MKQSDILKTLKTRWDEEGECFVAESDLWDVHIGCGDTKEEAIQIFGVMLASQWEAFEQGNHYMNQKVGRPALGRQNLTTRLFADVKATLKLQAKEAGVSVGELIERMTIEKFGLTPKF
jgi:hypothetical protein